MATDEAVEKNLGAGACRPVGRVPDWVRSHIRRGWRQDTLLGRAFATRRSPGAQCAAKDGSGLGPVSSWPAILRRANERQACFAWEKVESVANVTAFVSPAAFFSARMNSTLWVR